MTPDASSLSVQDRFQHLLNVISGRRFLDMQGLGNEVPFFICPFPPRDTVAMMLAEKQLVNRLKNQGVRVLEIDLYDLRYVSSSLRQLVPEISEQLWCADRILAHSQRST